MRKMTTLFLQLNEIWEYLLYLFSLGVFFLAWGFLYKVHLLKKRESEGLKKKGEKEDKNRKKLVSWNYLSIHEIKH